MEIILHIPEKLGPGYSFKIIRPPLGRGSGKLDNYWQVFPPL